MTTLPPPIAAKGTDPYHDYSDDERRKKIEEQVRKFATEPYFVDIEGVLTPMVPLFERAGIKSSPKLQQEIIRLTTEYVDMLLIQDTIRQSSDAKQGLQLLTKKEMVMWGTRSLEIFNRFKPELIQHGIERITSLSEGERDVLNKEERLDRGKMVLINSMVRLAMVTKEKINGVSIKVGDIPSALGFDIASCYYVDSTKETKPDIEKTKKERALATETLATEIIKEQMAQLRDSDVQRGR